MPQSSEDTQKAIAEQIDMSADQFQSSLHRLHDIAAQIGAFHMARVEIYQKTLEKMASAKDFQDVMAIQHNFIQSSMDNLLAHSKSITELMAHQPGPEFEEAK